MSQQNWKLGVCLIIAMIVSAGCDLSAPPACREGSEKCETSSIGNGTGVYQQCGANGEWGTTFSCGSGCIDNRCAKNSENPVCDKEGEFKCLNANGLTIAQLHRDFIVNPCKIVYII